jgi:hypothetical protein
MSGSPVYVDNRLIGAVSYALGSFSKEPIAGITPIAEMTDSASFNSPRPVGARAQIEFPLTRENLTAAFRKALNWNRPFADRAGDAQLIGVSGIAGGDLLTRCTTDLPRRHVGPARRREHARGRVPRSGVHQRGPTRPPCI